MEQLDGDTLTCVVSSIVDASCLLTLALTCRRLSLSALREWARRYPCRLRRPDPTLLRLVETAMVGIVTQDGESRFVSRVRVGPIAPALLPLVRAFRASVDGGSMLRHMLVLPAEVCPTMAEFRELALSMAFHANEDFQAMDDVSWTGGGASATPTLAMLGRYYNEARGSDLVPSGETCAPFFHPNPRNRRMSDRRHSSAAATIPRRVALHMQSTPTSRRGTHARVVMLPRHAAHWFDDESTYIRLDDGIGACDLWGVSFGVNARVSPGVHLVWDHTRERLLLGVDSTQQVQPFSRIGFLQGLHRLLSRSMTL